MSTQAPQPKPDPGAPLTAEEVKVYEQNVAILCADPRRASICLERRFLWILHSYLNLATLHPGCQGTAANRDMQEFAWKLNEMLTREMPGMHELSRRAWHFSIAPSDNWNPPQDGQPGVLREAKGTEIRFSSIVDHQTLEPAVRVTWGDRTVAIPAADAECLALELVDAAAGAEADAYMAQWLLDSITIDRSELPEFLRGFRKYRERHLAARLEDAPAEEAQVRKEDPHGDVPHA